MPAKAACSMCDWNAFCDTNPQADCLGWYACNGCHYMAFQAESTQAALATFDAYLKLLPDKFYNGDRLSGDAYRKINRRKASTAGHKTHIIVASNNETSTKSRYLWKM